MSGVPPKGTLLGDLLIDDTYFYHDGPKFFSCHNTLGVHYMAIAIDESETTERFLYLPVSEKRQDMIRTGGVALKEAFLHPEFGALFEVSTDYESEQLRHEVRPVDPASLPDEDLPRADARLSIPVATAREFSKDELIRSAAAEQRTRFAIRLSDQENVRTEYSARPLSIVLKLVQEAVDALGQEHRGKPTAVGSIPEDILNATELAVVDLQAASLVVVMVPSLRGTMIEFPLAKEAFDHLIKVLEATAEETQLRELIVALGPRSRSKVRELLHQVVDSNTDLGAYFADPLGNTGEVFVQRDAAVRALQVIETENSESETFSLIRVSLIGLNVRTGVFEIRDPAEQRAPITKYSGKVDPATLETAIELAVGEDTAYNVTLIAETTYSSFDSEGKLRYRLVRIEQLEAPTNP